MAGSKQGGKDAAKVNNQRTEVTIGGETIKIEPGTFYQVVGKLGGKKGKTGGTYGRPDWASKIGSIGGRRSKRGYRFIKESEQGLHYVDNTTGEEVVFKATL